MKYFVGGEFDTCPVPFERLFGGSQLYAYNDSSFQFKSALSFQACFEVVDERSRGERFDVWAAI